MKKAAIPNAFIMIYISPLGHCYSYFKYLFFRPYCTFLFISLRLLFLANTRFGEFFLTSQHS